MSTVDGGQAVVDAAVKEFGRVDIVVNNAGNVIYGGLPDVHVSVLDAILAVHVRGTFNVTRAAWPHMLAQNYGRVVLTGSTGMFGMPDNLSYATAKSAMIGMAQAMTQSAGDHDIKVNVIAPNAWTRMAGDPSEGMDQLRAARKLPDEQDFRQWKANLFDAYRAAETKEHTWHLPDGRTIRVVTTPNHPHLLWVHEHLQHLSSHIRAIADPASHVAEQRRLPWWR